MPGSKACDSAQNSSSRTETSGSQSARNQKSHRSSTSSRSGGSSSSRASAAAETTGGGQTESDPVSAAFAAFEEYHPSRLVAWLQRRLVYLEEAPLAVTLHYDSMPDHYATLHLQPDASAQEVRKAYLRLALHLHPDKPTGSDAEFRRLSVAYDILNDPSARALYDEQRLLAHSGSPTPRPPPRMRFKSREEVAKEFGEDLKYVASAMAVAIEELWLQVCHTIELRLPALSQAAVQDGSNVVQNGGCGDEELLSDGDQSYVAENLKSVPGVRLAPSAVAGSRERSGPKPSAHDDVQPRWQRCEHGKPRLATSVHDFF